MWNVTIPSKRWMGGIHSFDTRREALAFMRQWNMTEIKAHGAPIIFIKKEQDWKPEMNEKFKVGERVEVVATPYENDFPVGATGTVISVAPAFGEIWAMFEVKSDNPQLSDAVYFSDNTWPFYESELKPILH